ncbi:MAG: hypothetical protein LBW85_08475 [Deltaproteobacteria bacterium]|nr:hypothetical protein [Deltaproteobacteria bacterium]
MRKAFQSLATLFVSGRGASLGRLMMLTMFGFCLWHWAQGRQTPEHAFNFLVIMAGYVFGSKVVARIGNIALKKDKEPPQ